MKRSGKGAKGLGIYCVYRRPWECTAPRLLWCDAFVEFCRFAAIWDRMRRGRQRAISKLREDAEATACTLMGLYWLVWA